MNSPTLALACDLIARESVTPDDAGCLELIAARLAACGFQSEIQQYGKVTNLWATHGTRDPVLCYAGHTDVVPPGDLSCWDSPPFSPSIRNGVLYGRGAADMKGSLAAMVIAAEKFVRVFPHHLGTLAFLLTSDEEGLAVDGTKRVVEALVARGQKIQWCIVGEPSSQTCLGDLLRNGRRGSLNGRVWIHGVQGHVAYPHSARNPIHLAAQALAELSSMSWDSGNAFFPPTSFQISNLHAGTGAENVIPATLEAWFNFRFSTATTVEALQEAVRTLFDRYHLEYRLEWHLSGAPFVTAPGILVEAVSTSVREILGVEPQLSTGGGTSDGRFIATMGTEIVELGPVNATIHQVNECVRVAELDELAAVHALILSKLLKG